MVISVVTMELSRQDFRAMIFYDFKSGLNYHQSLELLLAAFGDQAPSESTVRRWFHEFGRGRASVQDEPRSGRPRTAVTDKNSHRVEKLLREERHITTRDIRQEVGIGSAATQTILHECLGVHKATSRWIPHLLSHEEKDRRVEWCQFMIEKFEDGRSKRVDDIVTCDETWAYCYDPETKRQ